MNEVSLPYTSNVRRVELQLPGPAERQALLTSYGAAACPAANAFQTPLELVLAAECAAELGPDPTSADLFDAYVRRRAASPVRGALRMLAAEMDAKVRSSLRVPEASLLLERAAAGPGAPAVDTVLACPLLTVRQGRVSFTYEQFGRFLTAEHLVIGSAAPTALVGELKDPRHTDLREFAVTIERDDNRRADLLLGLADEDLLQAAEAGQFGAGVSTRVRDALTSLLTEAKAATAAAELHPPAEAAAIMGCHWQMPGLRSAREAALLTVAGRSLRRGSYLTEVAALLDATDTRCAAEMRRYAKRGTPRRSAPSSRPPTAQAGLRPRVASACLPALWSPPASTTGRAETAAGGLRCGRHSAARGGLASPVGPAVPRADAGRSGQRRGRRASPFPGSGGVAGEGLPPSAQSAGHGVPGWP